MRPRWLDRRIAAPGHHLMLCLNERDYLRAMKHCRIKYPPRWVTEGYEGATHHLISGEGKRTAIVCLDYEVGRNSIEIYGLLVHEAVHVWQEYAENIGEMNPGREQEAYAIQAIAQELMAEFDRQIRHPD